MLLICIIFLSWKKKKKEFSHFCSSDDMILKIFHQILPSTQVAIQPNTFLLLLQ